MSHVCVVITTFNSERYLREISEAVKGLPVRVIDSGSTDKTVELANEQGWDVVHRPYRSQSDQLNWALASSAYDWVFILDSDEVPAFGAQQLIELTHTCEVGNYKAASVRRKNFVFGKWVRHGGWYPDIQVRLLRAGSVKYADVPIHSHPIIPSQVTFSSELELNHYAYDSVSQYWRKLDDYTTREAYITAGDWPAFNGRSRLKRIARKLPAPFFWHLIYRLVIKQGFRDGILGFRLALWSAVYQDVAAAKMRELQKRQGA